MSLPAAALRSCSKRDGTGRAMLQPHHSYASLLSEGLSCCLSTIYIESSLFMRAVSIVKSVPFSRKSSSTANHSLSLCVVPFPCATLFTVAPLRFLVSLFSSPNTSFHCLFFLPCYSLFTKIHNEASRCCGARRARFLLGCQCAMR
jgi:hypothetical protein